MLVRLRESSSAHLLFAGLVMSSALMLSGCGSGSDTTNIAEDSDADARAQYEAAVAASEAAMSDNASGN